MSDDLRALYQEVILDHGRHPRNFRHPEGANHEAHGENPLCGDTVTVFLTQDATGRIQDAAFEGHGCAISTASASLMTEIVKGKTAAEVEALFAEVHALCTGDEAALAAHPSADPDASERLQVLAGVSEFPMRVKCATLAWHVLYAAVTNADSSEMVTAD